MAKQEPRLVRLEALGGVLSGTMVIPLGIDRVKLPVPPTARLYAYKDPLDVTVTGIDYMEFETTHKWRVEPDEPPQEIFVCVHYGGDT